MVKIFVKSRERGEGRAGEEQEVPDIYECWYFFFFLDYFYGIQSTREPGCVRSRYLIRTSGAKIRMTLTGHGVKDRVGKF